MTIEQPKVLVIGLDGCPFDLLWSWIHAGQLPSLRRLTLKGTHGKLNSTIPSHSAPAWTSLVTGFDPGKHGIFDFTSRDGSVINATDVRVPKLWDYLSSRGLRSCVVNVPLTYPASKIHGVMVAGFPVPQARNDYVYPSKALDILNKHEYVIEAPFLLEIPLYDKSELLQKRWQLLKQEYEVAKRRLETVLELLSTDSWDFLFVVFKELDDVQHLFWDEPKVLLEFYQKLDEHIGCLANAFAQKFADNDVYVFVVSDHGFGPGPSTIFDLSNWIMHSNFNNKVPRLRKYINDIMETILQTPVFGQSLAIRIVRTYTSISSNKLFAIGIEGMVNTFKKVRQGKPFFRALTNGLYIEREIFANDAEYSTFVTKLHDQMPTILMNGKKVFKGVWKGDEIYKGPLVKELPDLIYTTDKEFVISIETRLSKYLTAMPGAHFDCPEGVLIISGENVKPIRLDASIYDVTPTILHIFGITSEVQLDGVILTEAFVKELHSQQEVMRAHVLLTTEKPVVFTKEEDDIVKERLRRLGYL